QPHPVRRCHFHRLRIAHRHIHRNQLCRVHGRRRSRRAQRHHRHRHRPAVSGRRGRGPFRRRRAPGRHRPCPHSGRVSHAGHHHRDPLARAGRCRSRLPHSRAHPPHLLHRQRTRLRHHRLGHPPSRHRAIPPPGLAALHPRRSLP